MIIDFGFKKTNPLIILFAEQRGMAQEVSLTTKKGVETKNYEGVST